METEAVDDSDDWEDVGSDEGSDGWSGDEEIGAPLRLLALSDSLSDVTTPSAVDPLDKDRLVALFVSLLNVLVVFNFRVFLLVGLLHPSYFRQVEVVRDVRPAVKMEGVKAREFSRGNDEVLLRVMVELLPGACDEDEMLELGRINFRTHGTSPAGSSYLTDLHLLNLGQIFDDATVILQHPTP